MNAPPPSVKYSYYNTKLRNILEDIWKTRKLRTA